MPSFQDSVFLFILALLLFGPKKLPVLARELGKWVGEFRRASNEFKMQMEDELRQSEQAERLKKMEAIEAAAPVAPALADTTEAAVAEEPVTETGVASEEPAPETAAVETHAMNEVAETAAPLPIAEAGEVKMMPPSTGLPTARSSGAFGGLLDAIPATNTVDTRHEETVETVHAD